MALKMALLLSGGGRSLQNLIDLIAAGRLPVELCLVISSHSGAYGLVRAQEAGLPTRVVTRRGALGRSEEVFAACRQAGAELVCLAGYLKLLRPIPADFQGKVLNIHPSLIPAFCGKGFYGERVHRAVLEAGAQRTGCTVHFVDEEYDQGPIILQRDVEVHPDDDVERLARRVFEEERRAYPEAIRLFAEGRLLLEEGRVRILP